MSDPLVNGLYVLDENGKPVLCKDIFTWGKWFENLENRHVALDENVGPNHAKVSTVFLAIDHAGFNKKGPPVLWETMIFGGRHDQYQTRATSREEALAGHQKAMNLARRERPIIKRKRP